MSTEKSVSTVTSYHNKTELGLIAPEAYSTAWLACVPEATDHTRPAWPQALAYLRRHQLADGSWGEPHVDYAHERLISTLGALYALCIWNDPADARRIARGVAALHVYAAQLTQESNEPIGFELLLPMLLSRLEPYNLELPQQVWSDEFKKATAQKMKLIGSLEVDYERPRTWWFNMEMLPEAKLVQIDESILSIHGSIATSTAATAAYLRALRLHGRDSERAAAYLAHVMSLTGEGGVGFCWPIEVFELTWVLHSFMRAGFAPGSPAVAPLVAQLARFWETAPEGLSWSQAFPLNDSDDTAAGYDVLYWAGLRPSPDVLLGFWDTTHFLTYHDERHPSVSANVHALSALRRNLSSSRHKQRAIQVTEWLRQQMDEHQQLNDKWHVSPLYVTAHAIPALLGWDNDLAAHCLAYILEQQDASGGWGKGRPNLEETSHAVLGLLGAWEAGLLRDSAPLKHAASFFKKQGDLPVERLWIGKTLYQPVGVTWGTVHAAQTALAKQEISGWLRPKLHRVPRHPFSLWNKTWNWVLSSARP